MNKKLKKVLIFLLLFIIVAAAIIFVELYLSGRHGGGTPSVPSAGAGSSESPAPSDAGAFTTEETAEGTKYSVTVPGSFISYSVTVDSVVFGHTRKDGCDLFSSKNNSSELLSICFKEGAKAASLAPGFLNSYINYSEFEQSGKNYLGSTKIVGEQVAANDGKTQFEAWLIDTDKGVLAVVISYDLADQAAQKPELIKMLSTLVIGHHS